MTLRPSPPLTILAVLIAAFVWLGVDRHVGQERLDRERRAMACDLLVEYLGIVKRKMREPVYIARRPIPNGAWLGKRPYLPIPMTTIPNTREPDPAGRHDGSLAARQQRQRRIDPLKECAGLRQWAARSAVPILGEAETERRLAQYRDRPGGYPFALLFLSLPVVSDDATLGRLYLKGYLHDEVKGPVVPSVWRKTPRDAWDWGLWGAP